MLAFSLPESSGNLRVPMSHETHEIFKLSPNYDLQKDRNRLIGVPFSNTPSALERTQHQIDIMCRRFDSLESDFDEKFRKAEERHDRKARQYFERIRRLEKGRYNDGIKMENLEKGRHNDGIEIENLKKGRYNDGIKIRKLEKEAHEHKYIFGVLSIIRIWANIIYDKIVEEEKRKRAEAKENETINIPNFKLFFSKFVYQNGNQQHWNNILQQKLGLPAREIEKIMGLVINRNLSAHSEKEFFRNCMSGSTALQKEIEILQNNLHKASKYEEKDPDIMRIAKTFLSNIQKEYTG